MGHIPEWTWLNEAREWREKYIALKEAVESFLIADATCSREDAVRACEKMVRAAHLEKYLPEGRKND